MRCQRCRLPGLLGWLFGRGPRLVERPLTAMPKPHGPVCDMEGVCPACGAMNRWKSTWLIGHENTA